MGWLLLKSASIGFSVFTFISGVVQRSSPIVTLQNYLAKETALLIKGGDETLVVNFESLHYCCLEFRN